MDEEQAEELASLRELALRLLSPFGHDISMGRRAQLLVGQLPANLPITLPLPADAHTVGSVVGEHRTDIFFDTKEPLAELESFYSAQMAAMGWQNMNVSSQATGSGRGGFVRHRPTGAVAASRPVGSSASQHMHEVFFEEESRASLSINARQPEGQVIPVQVTVQTFEHPEQGPWRHRVHNIFGMLPPLSPPEGSSQHSGGGSAGATEVWNFATLTTDLVLKAVDDHYTAQLIEGGWILVEAGHREHESDDAGKGAVWSYWRFTDDENRTWHGTFAVLCHPETPREYSLVIQAHQPAGPESNSFGVAGIYAGPIIIGH